MRLKPLILLGLQGLVTQMVTHWQRISVLCLLYLYVKSPTVSSTVRPQKGINLPAVTATRLGFHKNFL
jgi:hypothetical protein